MIYWIFSTIIFLILFSSFLFCLMYLYFIYNYSYWKRQCIPYLTPKFPFGNIESLARLEKCFGECYIDLYNRMKTITNNIGGLFAFSRPSLMILDLDLIRNILTKDFNHFQDRGMFSDEKANPLGTNLITLKGQKWKNLRSKLTPTFSSAKMKMMFEIMHECSRELKNIIGEHADKNLSINSLDLFARLTTDIIGSCAFGIQCNSLVNPDAEFRKYGRKVFEISPRVIIWNILGTNFPPLLRLLKISQISTDVHDFFTGALQQTVNFRREQKIERNDFLQLLMHLNDKYNLSQSEGISFIELAAQAFSFFAAGFETSSSTLNFSLYELANNIDVQKNLRLEILQVLKNSDNQGELTYDNLNEMKYLDKVICEVLRKYPPIPTLQRECTQDYVIPNMNFTIKKGTKIVIPSMGMHMDKDYFPDPEKFDPERFSEDQKKLRNPYVYLPFGEGPRGCIGMRFALLQVKIALVLILQEFQFSLDPETISPIKFNPKSIFLSPKHQILLRVEKY